MALESGKSQGKGRGIRTALVGAGLGLASVIGWNALDSKPDNEQIVKPDEDPKDVESGKAVALKAEGIKADVLQQLEEIPSDLPHLKGVIPETLEAKNKRLLQEIDQWLHVPAQTFDLTPAGDIDISDEEREHFMNYKEDFKIAVEETKQVMKDDPLFWEAKQKIDAAFPNYELMGEIRDEDRDNYEANAPTRTWGYLMERPKLTNNFGRTTTGLNIGLGLEVWRIYNENGVMYLQMLDTKAISGNIEDFISKMEMHKKNTFLTDTYNN